jgi:hypothetical protein
MNNKLEYGDYYEHRYENFMIFGEWCIMSWIDQLRARLSNLSIEGR